MANRPKHENAEKRFECGCNAGAASLLDPEGMECGGGFQGSEDRKLPARAHIRVVREDASGPIMIQFYQEYHKALIGSLQPLRPELAYELPVPLAAELAKVIVDALAAN